MITDNSKLSELTVKELKDLIYATVKDAVNRDCDLLCTYEQAAIILNCSKNMIYKYIHELKLHPIKQHGNAQKFIKTSELNKFLTSKTLFINKVKD